MSDEVKLPDSLRKVLRRFTADVPEVRRAISAEIARAEMKGMRCPYGDEQMRIDLYNKLRAQADALEKGDR